MCVWNVPAAIAVKSFCAGKVQITEIMSICQKCLNMPKTKASLI